MCTILHIVCIDLTNGSVAHGSVAQSVNHLIINREISRSIPSCVTGHGVSIVDAQLRIPLDLCRLQPHGSLSQMLEKSGVRVNE